MREVFIKSGQSMIEVIFTIGVAAIILTGIVSVATVSVRNSSFARDNALATKYAQEAMEWLRAERDGHSWTGEATSFAARGSTAPGTTYCLSSLSWPSSGTCGPSISGTNYKREVNLVVDNTTSPTFVTATVTVAWTDSTGTHNATTTTNFYNWERVIN